MNMNTNKALGAFLVAGIVAMVSGFISKAVVHSEEATGQAYTITASESAGKTSTTAVPIVEEDFATLMASANIEKGKKLSKACTACHSFDQGGKDKMGPNLWGLVNSNKAFKGGFPYSKALMAKGGKWTPEELNEFIKKPKAFVPGTKMAYTGMKKAQRRADLIAWLKTLK